MRSRMGHLDGDARVIIVEICKRETCLAANMRKAWAFDQLTQLWGQITCRKCARKTNPRIPLLNQREKTRFKSAPTHAGGIPTPRFSASSSANRWQSHENVLRFSTISHGRRSGVQSIATLTGMEAGSGSFGEIQTCNPSVKSECLTPRSNCFERVGSGNEWTENQSQAVRNGEMRE